MNGRRDSACLAARLWICGFLLVITILDQAINFFKLSE